MSRYAVFGLQDREYSPASYPTVGWSPSGHGAVHRGVALAAVSRIELYHVSVPLPVPFRPSWIPGYPQTHNRFDLVRVVTDDGVQGWSAGPAMGRERRGIGDLIGPYLLGVDPTDIETVQQRLREM